MENVTITVNGNSTVISSAGSLDDATVVETDLLADNGVIHKVDGVLLPSFVSTDIIGLANTSLNGDFTVFFKYFEVIGGSALLGALDEGVTLLAPTDEACNALGQETLESLSQAELTQILSNHVLGGVLPSFAISDGQVNTSLGGLEWTFRFVNDSLTVNYASIVKADVLANDGIVHAIDMVLLPDSFFASNPSNTPTPTPTSTPKEEPASDPTSTPTSNAEPASTPTSAGSTNGTNDDRPTVPIQVDKVQNTPGSSKNPNLYLLSLLMVIPLGGVTAWYYNRADTKPTNMGSTMSIPSTTTALSKSRPDPDWLAPVFFE
jgi:uncharacterized surface protein with fasciclin (FAS1) repeats